MEVKIVSVNKGDGKADLTEQTVGEQLIYDGKIIRVEKLSVSLPNGREATREVVRHPGAVAVIAETKDMELIVVLQWRKAIDGLLLEVPAGKLEPGEDPAACALRELEEETGFLAGECNRVTEFFTSPGFSDEKITLFYARQLREGNAKPDDDEFLHLRYLSREEIVHLLKTNQVQDAKTLVAFQWWLAKTEGQ